MDILIYVLPALVIFSLFAGVYFTFFAKKDQARQFVTELFDEEDRASRSKRMQQQFILKKKRDENQSEFFKKLDMEMERANLYLKPNEYILVSLGCAFVTGLIVYMMDKPMFFVLLGAVGGLFLPKLYIKFRIQQRMGKAQKEFSDVLDTFVNCFKSGYGFSRAVQVVADNFEDPWSTELGKVAAEMNFGSSLDESLLGLTKRVPTADVGMFVTAVMIQKETGGNLAELLTNLSGTIRERYKLYSKVKALSAQGKLSAIIIFLIPFFMGGIFYVMFPEIMINFFHHPLGIALCVVAGFMQLIGGIVLKNIVSLEV